MKNSPEVLERKDILTMEERYQRAQNLVQGIWTDKIALNDTIYPIWIGDSDCFWYERILKYGEGPSASFGKEYRLVDAKTGSNRSAFDHNVLAEVLANVAATKDVDSFNLPIKQVEISLAPPTITFTAFDKRWVFDSESEDCREVQLIQDDWLPSPNGKQAVFTRDHNLWVRDLDTGDEKALTKDGHKDYSYGAVSTAWGSKFDLTALPQAQWSPDSKVIFTVQRDTRRVLVMPIVHHIPKDGSLRPQVSEAKLALPGDDEIETLRLLAVHIESGRIQESDYHQIPVCSPGHGFFTEGKGWWGSDSRHIYFIDLERGYKAVRVVECNVYNGATRVLFEETSNTHINLNQHYDDRPTFLPLPSSNEVLWYSERSGWAHLYLYDLKTGQLKHPVSEGNWLIRRVLAFDVNRREVFVQTAGRGVSMDSSSVDKDRDPYYCDLARINIDTCKITTLIASDDDYYAVSKKNFNTYVAINMGRDAVNSNSVSPTGNFAVVTRSRADTTPVSLLVSRDGQNIKLFETADISVLGCDWEWPQPINMLGADGKTKIYGLVFRPSKFSEKKSYPIVSHVFNTPEITWVSKGSFSNGACLNWPYLDAMALAELGFIVVQVDGRGTPHRHKEFQDHSYGSLPSGSDIADHVTIIRHLANRYPYMDINRVGITSHPAGGTGTMQGLLQYPELYKVGVTGCLHDRRFMSASMLAEKFEGMAPPNYQPLEKQVEKLQGKLLLMHGLLDSCVLPTSTLHLVEALQKANKDFDMLLLPNMGHASSPDYLTRRVWDYLVRYLMKVEPPKEFKLDSSSGGYDVTQCDDKEKAFTHE